MTLNEWQEQQGGEYVLANRPGFPFLRLYPTGATAQAVSGDGRDGWSLRNGNGAAADELAYYTEKKRQLTAAFNAARLLHGPIRRRLGRAVLQVA